MVKLVQTRLSRGEPHLRAIILIGRQVSCSALELVVYHRSHSIIYPQAMSEA